MGCSALTKLKAKRRHQQEIFTVCPIWFIHENLQKVLDVYTFNSLIGEGTYGQVHLATHKLTNQQRAIKIVNKRNIKSSELKNKFINEISVLKMLDHPNIIKLYEFFEDDNSYYLVTDYLSGGELLDYILKNKVLSEKNTAKYIKQALESVAYLHSKNIVHRDIKLENLMLESNEPNALLKLIDFGTSIISSPFKKLKTYKGTISYLSPEVFENEYNEKCDLWSIGVIMYILLSGKMPFGGRDEGEIIRCITKGSFNIKGREWIKISPQATDLLKKLLNPNPKLRISASAALSHPWFTANIQEPSQSIDLNTVLSNLLNFRAEFKLQKAVMCFIANNLMSQAEKAELAQAFKCFDTAGDGKLSENDLNKACKKVLGYKISNEDIKKIIKEIDADKNGSIDYSEFLIATMNRDKLLSAERLEMVFKAFDSNGCGRITGDDIKELIESHEMEDSYWNKIVAEVDANGDGGVDLKEFKDMMLSCL
ncbi:hypothetical protein SteCoe_887 [Stentor coeruleus]|uniref:non-specific serine/threonine protein kinase n=1 Tax=Stentor coeruleus TaxID=5963 RepID=A0A1R2D344_9CILI|nr:hypothetical protein SteCoe_887 [Stentor coeruleus]